VTEADTTCERATTQEPQEKWRSAATSLNTTQAAIFYLTAEAVRRRRRRAVFVGQLHVWRVAIKVKAEANPINVILNLTE